jgi:predicted permease
MSPALILSGLALLGVAIWATALAFRWIGQLARWLPPRTLRLHLAAGVFMVTGTLPVVGVVSALRVGEPVPVPAWGLAALGTLTWLGGLWALLEGHRVLRTEGLPSAGRPSIPINPELLRDSGGGSPHARPDPPE